MNVYNGAALALYLASIKLQGLAEALHHLRVWGEDETWPGSTADVLAELGAIKLGLDSALDDAGQELVEIHRGRAVNG